MKYFAKPQFTPTKQPRSGNTKFCIISQFSIILGDRIGVHGPRVRRGRGPPLPDAGGGGSASHRLGRPRGGNQLPLSWTPSAGPAHDRGAEETGEGGRGRSVRGCDPSAGLRGAAPARCQSGVRTGDANSRGCYPYPGRVNWWEEKSGFESILIL